MTFDLCRDRHEHGCRVAVRVALLQHPHCVHYLFLPRVDDGRAAVDRLQQLLEYGPLPRCLPGQQRIVQGVAPRL